MSKPPTDPAIVEERVNAVYRMLLVNKTAHQICIEVARQDAKDPSKAWNVSDRTIRRYIKRAKEYLQEAAAYDRNLELGRAIKTFYEVIAGAMRAQDWQRVIAARRELNLIYGLYAPPPVQTLRVLGWSEAQLSDLATAMESAGANASDVFAAMIAHFSELASVEQPIDDDDNEEYEGE